MRIVKNLFQDSSFPESCRNNSFVETLLGLTSKNERISCRLINENVLINCYQDGLDHQTQICHVYQANTLTKS